MCKKVLFLGSIYSKNYAILLLILMTSFTLEFSNLDKNYQKNLSFYCTIFELKMAHSILPGAKNAVRAGGMSSEIWNLNSSINLAFLYKYKYYYSTLLQIQFEKSQTQPKGRLILSF